MKLKYLKKNINLNTIGIFLLILFAGFSTRGQIKPIVQDTTTTGFSKGSITLKDPKSIVEIYKYDPETDTYIRSKIFDDFPTTYPDILLPEEYEKRLRHESMKTYFRDKLSAIDGKNQKSDDANRDLLPRYYVKSGLFETIFGSNTIDLKPTGTLELDLGGRFTKQDNPAFSPRNRSVFAFEFNQRIALSLMGKIGTRVNVNINYDTQSTFSFQNLVKISFNPEAILGSENTEMLGKVKQGINSARNIAGGNIPKISGKEDSIIKLLEVGNVDMQLNSSLIKGSQSLFGVKTKLQFGKTTITGVFAEQKSQNRTVVAEGGGTIQNFDLFALDYDSDRHFFLSQYFRNKYDSALKNYPFVNSRVNITRIEVWVTNRQNRVNTTTGNNLRNIIALQDLGEGEITDENGNPLNSVRNKAVVVNPVPAGFFTDRSATMKKPYPADNKNNKYDPLKIGQSGSLLNSRIREIATADSGFSLKVNEGADYGKLENARKLSPNEYALSPQLGYISLQQRLTNDEVLAVAYQYTIGDDIYQVGEFGNDGVDATVVTGTDQSNQAVVSQALVLKMLKSNLTNVNDPIWNLMMKNIYQIPGALQLQRENFKFNILYTDPSPINYIKPVQGTSFPENPTVDNVVTDTPLMKVLNLDKLNFNNDPQVGGDGFFDFLPGLTVDPQNGRIIFTTKEPFGELIFSKLADSPTNKYQDITTYNANQKKYVFKEMYVNTQAGALQDADKNKYLLRGRYKSTGGDGIPIGAFNVPRGSVVVTAGGRVLVEGIDYSVNYQLGKVQILDPSLQASNTPINVSVENNSIFGQQTKRFFGIYAEHQISEKFMLGATFLKLSERPFTQKSSFGQEAVNNSMYGFNGNYASEIPFFTRLVNKLPNTDTDVPSNLSIRGEVAFLKPDNPKGNSFQGESTIYVDDFEGSQSTIDMRSPFAWKLSSTPLNDAQSPYNFNAAATDLSYGFKRAKLAWYTLDPVFFTTKPAGISNDDLSQNSTRRIYNQELYPLTDIVQGQSQVINTLDLTYFPTERGPYNNNLKYGSNPKNNFGGIMRALNSTNFEQSNVEFIQFWVQDPYVGIGAIPETNTGKIYFNLGEISEDILKDGRKQFENGLGPDQVMSRPIPNVANWGNVPASQSLIYAFDVNPTNRTNQDVGLDGLPDSNEASIYNNFKEEQDPAADNYKYYLNESGGIIDRYKYYNGLDGNSKIDINDPNRASSVEPDVEDVNRDNTMNTINAYYEYEVNINPKMRVGQNYVTDIRSTEITMDNGQVTSARWIQFKIPIAQPDNVIGNISEQDVQNNTLLRSVRFMRMFMTGFSDNLTLRFGALDLVRGDWRRYTKSLDPTDPNTANDNTLFDIQAVNLQENNDRCPINYIVPPGVRQEQLFNANTVINQNEQSLSLRVGGSGLEPQDSRAVFKNVNVDMRQFKKLKMFLHAESLPEEFIVEDNKMMGFIRFGNDFTQNFYHIEIPLKVTQPGSALKTNCSALSADAVWPAANEIDLALSLLTKIKVKAMSIDPSTLPPDGIYYQNEDELDPSAAGKVNKLRIGIRGNPDFGLVRNLMLGVKNNDDELPIKGEVWFNELRVAGMDNGGGMAAVLNVDTNFADFLTISATGNKSTLGFGSIEQGPNQRSRQDSQQYNIVTNFSLGKLLPPKWAINLPFNYAIGEHIITPEYDPFNADIKLKQLLANTDDAAKRDIFRSRAIDYTKRKSINFIGVRKDRGSEQKQNIYDIENFTLSQSFNQVERHDFEVEEFINQESTTTVDYTFSFQPKAVEPFKKSKLLAKNNYWKAIQDFNFNFLPSNINFNSTIIRQFNRQQFRQVQDVAGIGLDPLFRRNYAFNYNYGFTYNLSKNLKLNYTATTNNIVKNYLNDENMPIEGVNIWDGYLDTGLANLHDQQLIMNYEIPLDKIPVLKFIKANYAYTGDFSWQRASSALSNLVIDGTSFNLGNTIQNSINHNLTTNMNMDLFYKYIGLTKERQVKSKEKAAPKPGEKIAKNSVVIERNGFVSGLIGIITSVKTIQATYTKNSGTVLPGYTPALGFLGTAKPTLGFVFGSQDDVRFEAAKNGWLTTYQNFNQNFTQVNNEAFKSTINIDLLPDLKIDLSLDRSYSNNFSEQYDVNTTSDGVLRYNSRSPYNYGMFAISTVLVKTAFSVSNENTSETFDNFRTNRTEVANRLALERQKNDVTYDPTIKNADGYPVGFGKNSQAVLLPAFLAAYSGQDVATTSLGIFKSIPLPNWSIKYNGLMRFEFFKSKFNRFSFQHNYRSSYTINEFRSNFEFDKNPKGVDVSGNFFNQNLMSNINLVEQFNPLLRMDFELKNSLKVLTEIKKDRALSMSFDNNLLTEVRGLEYIVGIGYRIKDVVVSSRLADRATGIIKSDIIIKADFSYRNNKTIVRYLDYDNNQLAGGQDMWSIKCTADYSFSKNFTAIFYYDHAFSQAVISTAFPLTNVRSGFTVRYNFGN